MPPLNRATRRALKLKSFQLPWLASGTLMLAAVAQAHPGHGTDVPEALIGEVSTGTLNPTDQFTAVPSRVPDLSKERTLYVVGYSHLDTQWRWSYPQVIRQLIPDTMNSNFKLFEKYPNYVFNFSGSRRYEMMREYFPADYQRVKAYITAGRWFPCGSSVDEGDSIVPNLESMVRHTLYGNRFFRSEFGIESREFMLPDCFGFPAGLPTIIAHNGLRGFSTQKLTWGSANGIPFKVGNWIGPDGKSVVAALDPGAYTGSVKEDLSESKYWRDRIEANGAQSQVFTDYHYYGAGDRGGAPSDDSVHWVEHSVAGDGPLKVISSRAEDMFNAITTEQKKRLPNYTGELLLTEHSAGAITSQAYMKRWNRKSELLADAAERASVAAMWLGAAPYPSKKLYDSWDLVLGSQMHDMLPGTSLPKAYEYCWNDYLLAQNGFAAAAQDGIAAVTGSLDTRTKGVALAVFNPLSIVREDCVEATVTFPNAAPNFINVFGPDGKPVPAQIVERLPKALKIVFLARVPSVGLAVFDVRGTDKAPTASTLKVTPFSLENERFRVRIDRRGDVDSIFDKQAQKEVLSAPLRLAFQTEKPARYPAWNMDWKDRQNPPRGYVEGASSIRIVENGPARVALQITREAEGSRFVQTIRLAAGAAGNRLDFDTRIDWQSRDCSLKAVFPLAVSNPQATYDAQIGTVTRGNNDPKKYEVPQQQWFDLSSPDGKYGVSVFNDSKYGGDKPGDNTLRLTLLYTPNADNQYQDQGTQDLGHHQMLYSVAPHSGDWRQGGSVWGAARLNQPLLAFQTPSHDGPLGKTFSLLRVSTPRVQISAIKKAEDGNGIIIRLRELTGTAAKDVRIAAASPIRTATEVDGQERSLGTAHMEHGVLETDIPAYGLRAFSLRLAPPKRQAPAVTSSPVPLPYNLDAVSYDRNRADGGFDAAGRTLAAEELPSQIVSEGITFRTGPKSDGAKNAVTANGQKITLPAGNWDRVYVLAAANGPQTGTFTVGDRPVAQKVAAWGGYLGSWDLRTWDGAQPELTYNWPLHITGLLPGYVQRDEVAWQCSHRHHPTQGNEFYERTYLFKYGFDLKPGERTLTLPKNSNIRIFAVSVARNTNARVLPAQPLYDTLENSTPNAPTVTALPNLVPGDSIRVEMRHPLYGDWNAPLHYTLDGTVPTEKSPVYREPIFVSGHTDFVVRQLGSRPSAVTTASFSVLDSVPPALEKVEGSTLLPEIRVTFSEPIEKTAAANPANYILRGATGLTIQSATLDENGRTVLLKLSDTPSAAPVELAASAIRDLTGNQLQPGTDLPIQWSTPVVDLSGTKSFDGTGNGFSQQTANLPISPDDSWTINQWVYVDEQPEELTILGGFGSAKDQSGSQRYLMKYKNAIHFWGSEIDVNTGVPLDVQRWQMLTATYDGRTVRLYKDGRQIGSGPALFTPAAPTAQLAPPPAWDKKGDRFKGQLANFTIYNAALSPEAIAVLLKRSP